MTAPAIYTVEDLADRWGVNHKTVRSMIANGEIRHFRVGRQIKVHEAALAEYEGWNIERSGSGANGTSHGRGRTASGVDPSVPWIPNLPSNA